MSLVKLDLPLKFNHVESVVVIVNYEMRKNKVKKKPLEIVVIGRAEYRLVHWLSKLTASVSANDKQATSQ
jgi:hypothetical protein